jgi:hypothetical protein
LARGLRSERQTTPRCSAIFGPTTSASTVNASHGRTNGRIRWIHPAFACSNPTGRRLASSARSQPYFGKQALRYSKTRSGSRRCANNTDSLSQLETVASDTSSDSRSSSSQCTCQRLVVFSDVRDLVNPGWVRVVTPRHPKRRRPRPPRGLSRFDLRQDSGDGGNRTHVRNRVRVASTSVAGALISSLARLAGGVVRDQPP